MASRLRTKMTFLGKGGKTLRGSESEKLLLVGGGRRGPESCWMALSGGAVCPPGGFLSSPRGPGAKQRGLAVSVGPHFRRGLRSRRGAHGQACDGFAAARRGSLHFALHTCPRPVGHAVSRPTARQFLAVQ